KAARTPSLSRTREVRTRARSFQTRAFAGREGSISTTQRGPSPGSASRKTTSVPKTASNSARSARSRGNRSDIPGMVSGKTSETGPLPRRASKTTSGGLTCGFEDDERDVATGTLLVLVVKGHGLAEQGPEPGLFLG